MTTPDEDQCPECWERAIARTGYKAGICKGCGYEQPKPLKPDVPDAGSSAQDVRKHLRSMTEVQRRGYR